MAAVGCSGGQLPVQPSAIDSSGVNEQPWVQMTGVRAEVSRQGQLVQRIEADWARFDETDRVVRLRDTTLRFYDNGQPRDYVSSGRGTMWMEARPEEKIGRNDIKLEDNVTYASSEGWLLQSGMMHFDNGRERLWSDSGYALELQAGENKIVGEGRRFEVDLKINQGTLSKLRFVDGVSFAPSMEPVN